MSVRKIFLIYPGCFYEKSFFGKIGGKTATIVGQVTADSALVCQAECEKKKGEGCEFFTWEEDTSNCYLQPVAAFEYGIRSRSTRTAGFRDCAGTGFHKTGIDSIK